MARVLAQIAEVVNVWPIEGADNIELIQVHGWKCVALKGEFVIGSQCVYFELDSLLDPTNPAFARMEKHKFRVKTMKLNRFNVLSQGLALPLSAFSSLPENPETGTDLTDFLKIKKWDPEEHIPGLKGGTPAGNFPSYVPKTDETRIQSKPYLLEELKGETCYVALKCDGSSATFAHLDGKYEVCSRNMSLKSDPPNAWSNMSSKYNLEEKLRAKGNFAVQGELCSPGVQKNKLKLTEPKLFVFNVYDIQAGRYLDYENFITFCKDLDLETVPIINDNLVLGHTIDQLLEMARGTYDGTENPREGIVIRPKIERYSKVLQGRASFKIINNDYLVKNGE